MNDRHVEIELRRPSGTFFSDNEELEKLQERQAEVRSQRISEWLGRVSRVLNPDS